MEGPHEELSGLFFHTKRGNQYFYDDNTGLVFVCPRIMRSILLLFPHEESSSIVRILSGYYPGEDVGTWSRFVEDWSTNASAFFFSNRKIRQALEPTASLVADHLSTHGFRQLILVVTEECNMRCQYCLFSPDYPFEREYSSKSMDLNTAKMAIDYYLQMLVRVRKRDPQRIPVITFYGGEPLLEFELIRSIIEYVKSLGVGATFFSMTTNGTLLTESVVDYLVENDVSLAVSLDGPQSEHDRLRVTKDGRGTFDVVVENLRVLRERHPTYSLGHVISCYDWGTDLVSVKSFFDAARSRLPFASRASPVDPQFTTYYARYDEARRSEFGAQLSALRREYFIGATKMNKREVSYLDVLIGAECKRIVLRSVMKEGGSRLIPYSGACIPGEKVCVSHDGIYHMCEKINERFPIGNVDHGLDFAGIARLISEYQERIIADCGLCPITRLCTACFSNCAGEGRLRKEPEDVCLRRIEDARNQLSYTFSILEENPGAFNDTVFSYYDDIC